MHRIRNGLKLKFKEHNCILTNQIGCTRMNNFLHQESETLKEKGKSVSKQIDSEIINIIVILIYFRNQAHRLRDLVKLKFQLLYI